MDFQDLQTNLWNRAAYGKGRLRVGNDEARMTNDEGNPNAQIFLVAESPEVCFWRGWATWPPSRFRATACERSRPPS
jgi:hypothetical protein